LHDIYASIANELYEHRGIPHSEMALIIHTCKRLGIEAVIESGRARGQSTYMLAKYLPETAIHSVEMRGGADQDFGIARVKDFANVTLHDGDGAVLLPALCADLAPRRIAVLCDGPKGAAAVKVIEACFACPNVLVGFVHDMRKLDHGSPSPHRAAAIAAFPSAKFSDDDSLVINRWMDANVLSANGPVGPAHEQEFGSYGPTVGVFLNPLIH
jgi:hypothetical protein